MKDAVHHKKYVQKKVLQEERRKNLDRYVNESNNASKPSQIKTGIKR